MLSRLWKGSDSNCEIVCVQCCGREFREQKAEVPPETTKREEGMVTAAGTAAESPFFQLPGRFLLPTG